MKKNFLISTGGTGGHVVPAIILSDHLREKCKVIISTDKRGLRYLNKDINKIEIVNTPKLNNIFLVVRTLCLTYLCVQLCDFLKIIRFAKCRVEQTRNTPNCVATVSHLNRFIYPYFLFSESSETLCESC